LLLLLGFAAAKLRSNDSLSRRTHDSSRRNCHAKKAGE
jgi:hypothetical protein